MAMSSKGLRNFCLIWALVFPLSILAQDSVDSVDTQMVKSIFDESLTNGKAYELLDYLCHVIGPRLSGSENADRAVWWTKKVMEEFGFDHVYLQEVMVPHWVRGRKEQARVIRSKTEGSFELSVLALGGSVPTPEAGLNAEVIEVQSLDEVTTLGEEKIKGKIVFYSRPFDQQNIRTGASYGGAVDQRTAGPVRAAEFGAVAVVIRSVGSAYDDAPHTGSLRYEEGKERIPAAALGVQSADRLSNLLKKEESVRLFLKINSKWMPDAKSYNVIGELEGQEFPEEIILVGGHLDSWDVGQGAHDDGTGCMQAIDVLRTFKALEIKPKRTIRAVMFMNEENGLRGGTRYAELAKESAENHVIAIESDGGGFTPRGFGVGASEAVVEKIQSWLPHFDQNTISYINSGGGGADIGPLGRGQNVPTVGLIPDSQRYFDVHHSRNDVFEAVNRRELALGAASMAALIYLVDKYGL